MVTPSPAQSHAGLSPGGHKGCAHGAECRHSTCCTVQVDWGAPGGPTHTGTQGNSNPKSREMLPVLLGHAGMLGRDGAATPMRPAFLRAATKERRENSMSNWWKSERRMTKRDFAKERGRKADPQR